MQVIGLRIRLFVVLGAVAAIVVGLVTASGSPSRSPKVPGRGPSSRFVKDREVAHRIEALYAGISQHGEALGDPNAPVTLQFFADLECPEARHFTLGALPFIVRRWVHSGKLRIVYRAYPAETIWPHVFSHQQAAALAAGRQGELWQYLDFFYHYQGPEYARYVTPHFLEALAKAMGGLDFARWQAARRAPALGDRLRADRRLAHAHGIHETPAFLIGPTGGRAMPLLHFSLLESRAFDEAIEDVLAGRA